MLKSTNFKLSVLQFLQYFLWGFWFVTAGTYMIKTLGFSGREVGLVYASSAIAASVSPFILGTVADRLFATEKLLAILHTLGGCLLILVSFSHRFEVFFPLIFIYLLCYLPTFSLSNAMCFHHISDAKKDFPRIRVWGTIAWIVAGLIVGFLQIEDQVLPFRISAFFSFILGIYSLSLPHTPPQPQSTNFYKSLVSPEIKELFKDKAFMILIISIALICVPNSYYYSFVNPFLNEMGVSNAAGKMTLGQVTEIFLMLSLPWFFRIWRLKTIIFIGLFFWGFRYYLLIWGTTSQSEFLYILFILLHGIAYVFSSFAAQIYLDTKVPNHLRSTAQGFYTFLTMGVMAFIGTSIAGESVNYFTLSGSEHEWNKIWLVPSTFGVCVAFFFLFFFKSKAKG